MSGKVETLRNKTEAIKSIYPRKLMVAGKIFENEARKAGYIIFKFNSISTSIMELLNPNMYREIVLIDGDMDFVYSKTITNDSFIE